MPAIIDPYHFRGAPLVDLPSHPLLHAACSSHPDSTLPTKRTSIHLAIQSSLAPLSSSPSPTAQARPLTTPPLVLSSSRPGPLEPTCDRITTLISAQMAKRLSLVWANPSLIMPPGDRFGRDESLPRTLSRLNLQSSITLLRLRPTALLPYTRTIIVLTPCSDGRGKRST